MRILENKVDFAELKAGDCFRYEDGLWIKCCCTICDAGKAARLNDGVINVGMDGEMVAPVNAEVRVVN